MPSIAIAWNVRAVRRWSTACGKPLVSAAKPPRHRCRTRFDSVPCERGKRGVVQSRIAPIRQPPVAEPADGWSTLSRRELAVLVCATASALRDSYCSLAWGKTLAKEASASAAAVIADTPDASLTARDRAPAAWARKVVSDPNAIVTFGRVAADR